MHAGQDTHLPSPHTILLQFEPMVEQTVLHYAADGWLLHMSADEAKKQMEMDRMEQEAASKFQSEVRCAKGVRALLLRAPPLRCCHPSLSALLSLAACLMTASSPLVSQPSIAALGSARATAKGLPTCTRPTPQARPHPSAPHPPTPHTLTRAG